MTGKFGTTHSLLLLAWIPAFVTFGCLVWVIPSTPLLATATERKALKVYSSPRFYRALDTPAEFGLDQLASFVNYLLLAAAAVLAFLAKTLLEFRTEVAKEEGTHPAAKPTRGLILIVLHAAIACSFSLTWGAGAYVTLPDIIVLDSFSVTELGRLVIGQIAGLLLALVFLMVALTWMVRRLLP